MPLGVINMAPVIRQRARHPGPPQRNIFSILVQLIDLLADVTSEIFEVARRNDPSRFKPSGLNSYHPVFHALVVPTHTDYWATAHSLDAFLPIACHSGESSGMSNAWGIAAEWA